MSAFPVIPRGLRRFQRRNPEAVTLAVLFAYLSLVEIWTSALGLGYATLETVIPAWPVAPLVGGSLVTGVFGYGLAGVAFAAARGLVIPWGRPDLSARRVAIVAVLGPSGILVTLAVVLNVLDLTSISALSQRSISPSVAPGFLGRAVVFPAAVSAIGVGLLFVGAVHTQLRAVATGPTAVLLTGLVAGVFFHLPMVTVSMARPDLTMGVLFLVGVAVSVVIGLAVGTAYRDLKTDRSIFRRETFPLVVLGAVGLVGVIHTMVFNSDLVMDLLWLGTIVVAAHATDRTGSVWTAVGVLFTYRFVLGTVVYAEAVFGAASI